MELTEAKKQSKFSNWLLAIGLGAICGLMAIGSHYVSSYKKANAYEYQHNGTLIFGEFYADNNIINSYDSDILYNYFESLNLSVGDDYNYEFTVEDDDGVPYFCDSLIRDSSGYNLISDNLTVVAITDSGVFADEAEPVMPVYIKCEPSYNGYYELLQFVYDYHQNVNQDGMQDILSSIVSLLTGGIVGLSSGIGVGASTLTSDIFISNGALSTFGAMIIVFAAISLAIALCRWIMQFLTSLGAKK